MDRRSSVWVIAGSTRWSVKDHTCRRVIVSSAARSLANSTRASVTTVLTARRS